MNTALDLAAQIIHGMVVRSNVLTLSPEQADRIEAFKALVPPPKEVRHATRQYRT